MIRRNNRQRRLPDSNMAKVVKNNRGFLVIEVSSSEYEEKFGSMGLCDHCRKETAVGYHVAILNLWYCPKCYKEWAERATIRFRGDVHMEERRFNEAKEILGI